MARRPENTRHFTVRHQVLNLRSSSINFKWDRYSVPYLELELWFRDVRVSREFTRATLVHIYGP